MRLGRVGGRRAGAVSVHIHVRSAVQILSVLVHPNLLIRPTLGRDHALKFRLQMLPPKTYALGGARVLTLLRHSVVALSSRRNGAIACAAGLGPTSCACWSAAQVARTCPARPQDSIGAPEAEPEIELSHPVRR